jgi:hypothetical protein
MAKRTRASAPGPRKAARPRPTASRVGKLTHTRRSVGVRINYTPELLADGRCRFEQTDEPVVSIANGMGISKGTLWNLAARLKWQRYQSPPRDLLATAKLLAHAEGIKQADLAPAPRSETSDSLAATPEQQPAEPALPDAADPAANEATSPPAGDIVERLHRAVLDELTAVETMRAELRREPQSPIDAERTARTLAIYTATLQKLQRLQCATPQTGPDDDDIPLDIDEFRNELARCVDEFVKSRTDP